jgi:hypothetical protein
LAWSIFGADHGADGRVRCAAGINAAACSTLCHRLLPGMTRYVAWGLWSPTPDATEVTMGNSGMNPKDASESCFVAAEGTGVVVPHIELPGDIVALFLQTTRVVGTVDSDG